MVTKVLGESKDGEGRGGNAVGDFVSHALQGVAEK